jgi:hypothetical protein
MVLQAAVAAVLNLVVALALDQELVQAAAAALGLVLEATAQAMALVAAVVETELIHMQA